MPIISIDLIDLFLIVANAYGVLLVYLLARKGWVDEAFHNYWFAGFIAILTLLSLNLLGYKVGVFNHYPHLSYVVVPISLMLGPLLFQYVNLLLFGKSLLRNYQSLLHLLPALSYLVVYSPYYGLSAEEKIATPWPDLLIQANILFAVSQLILVSYLWATNKILSQFTEKAKQQFSSDEQFKITWLRFLIFALLCRSIYGTLIYSAAKFTGWHQEILHGLFSASLIVLILVVCIKALSPRPEKLVISKNTPAAKYATSKLSDFEAHSQKQKLANVMKNDKLYLQNELSLTDLANALQTSNHQLSQLLNVYVKKSFYDYINELRTEHAKSLLLAENQTITQIAYESGFSSKASFYNAFKRNTNLSPSAWREQQRGQLSLSS